VVVKGKVQRQQKTWGGVVEEWRGGGAGGGNWGQRKRVQVRGHNYEGWMCLVLIGKGKE